VQHGRLFGQLTFQSVRYTREETTKLRFLGKRRTW